MPRVAVTFPYFDFFPELRADLEARYPGTKFAPDRKTLVGQELIDFLQGCDTAVIGVQKFDEAVLCACPELKVVSLCSAGVDHVDPALFRKYGIKMWWAAGINRVSVSELTLAYMVLTLRRVHEFSTILRAGKWTGPVGFGADLRGKTVGVHGVGHIGKAVIELLQGYGVTILANDRVDMSGFAGRFANVELVSAAELWARSDVLTIHLSKNATTMGLYDAAVLDQLKPGAIIINNARGGMFDEDALADRLESGQIAGAAFDVFAHEPANGHRLLDIPTFFASPHIGATTRESWGAMLRSGMRGIEQAYDQEPGVYPFD
jgi:D-3-phosphoglycerate dehydrogenase / 2-oxoglutarate reductase